MLEFKIVRFEIMLKCCELGWDGKEEKKDFIFIIFFRIFVWVYCGIIFKLFCRFLRVLRVRYD